MSSVYDPASDDSLLFFTIVVWVTPTMNATICVDYDDDGTVDDTTDVNTLASTDLVDPNDDDMSGAIVWAVAQGESCTSSQIVPIAIAWGQDPFRSNSGGNFGLDAGCMYKRNESGHCVFSRLSAHSCISF